jgi:lipopolysaccharide/colanic/teichoic acid biosynthesis glycosyltransferase
MTIHLNKLDRVVHESVPRRTVSLNETKALNMYSRGLKRGFDLFLVVLSAPLVMPIIGLLALLVALDGGKPFYTQMRVGRNGKSFRMWKLRTMVKSADSHLEAYLDANPAARSEWDATQKLKHDPRITRLGRFLRKSSLDELPQLFNVLNGSMSLVGPRPMMENQQCLYKGSAYFKLSPGITGLWQISDRNHCDFTDRVYYDEIYWREVSFLTDLRILFKTVAVVFRGTGF